MAQEYDEINWFQFLNSFLDLVELACKEIEDPKHFEIIGGIEIKYNTGLNVAIIYNMKHAIEIFIKTLIRIADNSLKEKIITHNMDDLFQILKTKMENGGIKKVIERLDDKKDSLASFTQQEIKEFETYTTEIQKIINYYYKLEFLNKNDITAIDTENTAFKYPENITQINAQINYFDFFFSYNLDIQKIREDIRNLKMNLNSIKTVFDLYHYTNKYLKNIA